MRTSPTPAEQFYGLRSRAFSLTPDLRFAYQSRSHSHALEQVTTALRNREGLIIVTGEIGTGKTMLCRTLLETFETRIFQSVILDPLLTVEELLYQVLTDFGLISDPQGKKREPFTDVTRHALVSTLQRFLSSLVPLDAHAVIMIDEAQHLGPQVLEEIRLLSNFETDQAKLLQIVLVGQPNLEGLLRRPDMRQLNQRVARRLELEPLNALEVGDYIERRLSVASALALEGDAAEPAADGTSDLAAPTPGRIFSPEAIEAIAGISVGIPRVVNTLCDRAMEAAHQRQIVPVDVDAVVAGAEHLKLPIPAREAVAKTTGLWKLYAAAAVLAAVAIGFTWWYLRPLPAGAPPSGAAATAPSSAPTASTPTTAQTPPASAEASGRAGDAAGNAPAATEATPPATSGTTATTAAAPGPAPAAARPPLPEGFQIFVAAFRTEQRAAEVADEVQVGGGLPVMTRLDSTGRLYSIIAGPYKTNEEARSAQARLERLGFSGTRISSVGPDVR